MALPRHRSSPGDKTYSLKCAHPSLAMSESVTSSSCTDLVVLGRAKLHSSSLKNLRLTLRRVGEPYIFSTNLHPLDETLDSTYEGFWKFFPLTPARLKPSLQTSEVLR